MLLEIESLVTRALQRFGREFGHGLVLTTDRIAEALHKLGDPQHAGAAIFHVAGTNGKGSTCAVLDSIARAAGLKTGLFTSPHLLRVNERIRVNGAMVEDGVFVDALAQVSATQAPLSYFEAITAAGFLIFRDADVDVIVLEVGLGGRFDSTNVVTPAVSVITPIDLDHQALLGDTIADIAGEKAGIIKPGRPVVCARQHEAAAAVIDEACARAEAPLIRAGREWDGYLHHGRLVVQTATRLFDLSPPCLIGAHQLDNAALAAAAMTTWGDARISEEALSEGVSTARWPGRMTRVRSTAHEIWIDGAHNPHGARALGATLAHLQAGAPKPVVMICGVFANKNCDEIVTTLAPNADYFIAVPVSGARASAEPSHLVELARPFAPVVEPAATLDVAIARATQLSPNARVIICGSLHLAGQALHLYSEI